MCDVVEATFETERVSMAVDDGWVLGSRVLVARCGPSGEVGPLRRDLAACAAAAAASLSNSGSPPPRGSAAALRDTDWRSSIG